MCTTSTTPIPRPITLPTNPPTPNPGEFGLFGYENEFFDIECDYLNNVFECGMYENFDYFGGLVNGTLLLLKPYPPQFHV